ncbi:MAG: DNA-processing protein DprA [Pseudomonadota bacterium]
MKEKNLPYHLALMLIPGIGIKLRRRILTDYPDLADFFNLSKRKLYSLGCNEQLIAMLKHPDWQMVERHIAWQTKSEAHHIISISDKDYPRALKYIDNPPTPIFVRGNKNILNEPQISMVGSRNATPNGARYAYDFAYHLAKSGLLITSGLAVGIDAASHQGALAAASATIAVMGTGITTIYPRDNKQLAEQIIAKGGALISEFSLSTRPRRENFPRRNRIISGLALGVLVVEAAQRSGSLITAKYALDQGREVFAIPSSPHNPMAKGCHSLLKSGAKLVENISDILQELKPQLQQQCTQTLSNLSKINNLQGDAKKCLDCIKFEPSPIDLIIQQAGLEANKVSSCLMQLELSGMVMKSAYGYQIKHEWGNQ